MGEVETARLHLIVEGRVQGVGFRYFVVDVAEVLKIKGWVRNRWDDESVEVLAEGEKTTLEKFLKAVKKGPSAAFVSEVKVDWETPTGEFSGFHVKSTA